MTKKLSRTLTWILGILLAVKVLLLVLHTPLYGYANQSDFIRIMTWFGLRAVGHPLTGVEGFLEGPFSTYSIAPVSEWSFGVISSQILIVAAAILCSSASNYILGYPLHILQLHWVGVMHSIILLGSTFIFLYHSHKRCPLSSLLLALCGVLYFSDPLNTLYFNTLYTYPSAFLFSYITMLYIAFRQEAIFSDKKTAIVLSLFLLLTGTAREQGCFLPLVVSLLAMFIYLAGYAKRQWSGFASCSAILLLPACAVLAIYEFEPQRAVYASSVNAANNTDTVLYSILPKVTDRREALRAFSLPEACEQYIGRSWYDEQMYTIPCKEILNIKKSDIAKFLLLNPSVSFSFLKDGLQYIKDPLMHYLGKVEGAKLRAEPYSLYRLWDELPFSMRLILLGLSIIHGITSTILLMYQRPENSDTRCQLFLASIASLFVVYAYISSILGDGYIALEQHFYLGFAFLPFSLTLAAAQVLIQLSKTFTKH